MRSRPPHLSRLSPLLAVALCCAALGACGGTSAPARQASSAGEKAVGGVAGYRAAARRSQHRAAREAEAQGAPRARFFSPASFWNRPVPARAKLDPASSSAVARLLAEVAREEEERRGPWINTNSYGVPLISVPATQPTVRVQLDHAPDAALSAAWSSVPLPDGARPAAGSDGYLVVWQPSTDRMWEFWRLVRRTDGWHASWGGAIEHVSRASGVYGPESWPGAKPWWGASASSLPLAGGAITIEELRRGEIDHALAISLPAIRAGVYASPARRTDGSSSDPAALPEGARLRLDPRLDLSRVPMPAATRAIATAAQRYGIIVRDFAGDVTFTGEDPTPTGQDPYHGPGGLYGGEYPNQLLASFPWAHLQLLAMNLHSRR